MNFRDFLLLSAVCFVWGLNLVVTRWVIAEAGVPPLFMGAVHFALLFMGLANAEASSVSVVGQLGVPFSTLMSMAFLGEVVGWRRGLGIMLAFAGAILIAVDPQTFQLSYGLLYVVLAALIASGAGILMKRMPSISAMQMQAWIG